MAQTGSCEMLTVGLKSVAGDARALVARLAPDPWKDLGHAMPGSLGLPALAGAGPLAALSANPIGLSNAAPSSVAMLVLGTSTLNAPLFGGLIVPAPLHLAALPTRTAAVPFTCHLAGERARGSRLLLGGSGCPTRAPRTAGRQGTG